MSTKLVPDMYSTCT